MSQGGNSCHYPEVTIQLNHYFYFIFTTEARTESKGPVATLGSIVWPDVASHRLWNHTELLSPQPAPTPMSGCSRTVWIPTQPCPLCWGTSAVPKRAEGPQPHHLGEQSCGSAFPSGLGPLQLQMDWDLSTQLYLHCVWKSQSSWQKPCTWWQHRTQSIPTVHRIGI